MSERTKEEIYDAEINPLMTQIIAICKEHKIALLATFELPCDDDPDLACTTALLADEYEPSEKVLEALRVIRNRPVMLAETITKTDTGTHISIRQVMSEKSPPG